MEKHGQHNTWWWWRREINFCCISWVSFLCWCRVWGGRGGTGGLTKKWASQLSRKLFPLMVLKRWISTSCRLHLWRQCVIDRLLMRCSQLYCRMSHYKMLMESEKCPLSIVPVACQCIKQKKTNVHVKVIFIYCKCEGQY